MTDWSSQDSRRECDAGTKDRQRTDKEDRAAGYRAWRWKLGNGLYCSDVDQIEWRAKDGKLKPVAILELTRSDGPIGDRYLGAILNRMTVRDKQGEFAKIVATALGVCAYIIVFRKDLAEFAGYNLTRGVGWRRWTQDGYRAWLSALGEAL